MFEQGEYLPQNMPVSFMKEWNYAYQDVTLRLCSSIYGKDGFLRSLKYLIVVVVVVVVVKYYADVFHVWIFCSRKNEVRATLNVWF